MPAEKSETVTVWKLHVKEGRQWWTPIEADPTQTNIDDLQTVVEKHLLTKKCNDKNPTYENEKPIFENPKEAARKAAEFYSTIQTEDGHWAGDYGGPLFLLPGLLIVSYITGYIFGEAHKREMIRYIFNCQNEDGGWGLHIEGQSTTFGSCLNYIALRILGISASDARLVKARSFIHKNGSALVSPQWGKFYMCTLGVMEWECMPPVPPELWLLPNWVPWFQPGKWWCHCRVVYLPMGFVYGGKYRAADTPLLQELRKELYEEEYSKIKWSNYRFTVAKSDEYFPVSWLAKLAMYVFVLVEKLLDWIAPLRWLRKYAISVAIDHIKQEDLNTKHIDIGPVNKVMNMLSVFYHEGNSEHFRKHLERIDDYLWLSDDGMKFQGYNGSQLWDTAFAVQAFESTGLADDFKSTLQRAHDFIDVSQVREDVPNCDKYYRHISNGAWPFSTRDHGWPISDCTAEGLKAALKLRKHSWIKNKLDEDRLADAVNVILSMNNKESGGWATYELTRTGPFIEWFNPSALYGNIMIDYPYVECTSACVQALCGFREAFPNHKRIGQVNETIARAVKFLKFIQKKDGGFYGSWGVCFCYGAWFGITGLLAAGESKDCKEIRKACEYLKKHQKEDGGWGESYLSCVKHEYVQSKRSQVINTSWSLLALMAADDPDRATIDRGVQLLLRRQLPNGDFPQENISGVFNHNCMITYTNYRNIFPLWALGVYTSKYCSK